MPSGRRGDAGDWPETLTANAWTGDAAVTGTLDVDAGHWAVRDHFAGRPDSERAAERRPDLADWRDWRVGWALVLPADASLDRRRRALADDVPEPLRRLAAARAPGGEPIVLRYEPADPDNLYRYYPDGSRHPLPLTGEGPRGARRGQLPHYLLLIGSPARIPWEVQFELNTVAFTGRLDLDEEGLCHYAEAALTDWAGSPVDSTAPLLWTVQHAAGDITWLMRQAVGERALAGWRSDPQIGDRARVLRGSEATGDRLAADLARGNPGVVVTTSHGMTGPAHAPERMRATLGWLVDDRHEAVDPGSIVGAWAPHGVVWYALACCSAGGSGRDQFAGLLEPGSDAARTVGDVAALGPVTAPFPRALLGAPRPARAFIGHVEPTFDWTLRREDTGLVTTDTLVSALYDQFFQATPAPVGVAFRDYYLQAASLRVRWAAARPHARDRTAARATALLAGLAGMDRQCMVILGDPAVAPAPLPPA